MARRFKHNKINGYPLPDRTVLYSRKKHMQPVPEVGEEYHCFDDGKISLSRHYTVKVKEVLGHMAFRKKYPEYFRAYVEYAGACFWLYSRRTDVFVVTEADDKGRNDEYKTEVFVRTKRGGWFSIGYPSSLYCGELDVTGRLYIGLVADLNKHYRKN